MEKIVRIAPTKIHPGAIRLLEKASPFDIDRLIKAIELGQECLFTVLNDDSEVIGAYVLRREASEMVIVAGAGDFDDGYSALHTCIPFIIAQSNQAGCETIRCHVVKKSIERMLIKWGFERTEDRGYERVLRRASDGRRFQ